MSVHDLTDLVHAALGILRPTQSIPGSPRYLYGSVRHFEAPESGHAATGCLRILMGLA